MAWGTAQGGPCCGCSEGLPCCCLEGVGFKAIRSSSNLAGGSVLVPLLGVCNQPLTTLWAPFRTGIQLAAAPVAQCCAGSANCSAAAMVAGNSAALDGCGMPLLCSGHLMAACVVSGIFHVVWLYEALPVAAAHSNLSMHSNLHRAAKALCYGVFVLVCNVVLELAELGCRDGPRAANSLSVWGTSVGAAELHAQVLQVSRSPVACLCGAELGLQLQYIVSHPW